MAQIHLATHGFRIDGRDPVHTPEGCEQIKALASIIRDQKIDTVVVGTGTRFQEMYDILKPSIQISAQVLHSIFCGTSDGLESDGTTVVLDNGRQVHVSKEYIGLIRSKCFDPWVFIQMFEDNILFLAGGELMIALGLGDINEKGQLFELDPATKTGKKIS